MLACASSDGAISVLEFENNAWDHVVLPAAHGLGVNAVSWAPANRPGQMLSAAAGGAGARQAGLRMFVSAGCDNLVKIWEYRCVLHTLVVSDLQSRGSSTIFGSVEDWLEPADPYT